MTQECIRVKSFIHPLRDEPTLLQTSTATHITSFPPHRPIPQIPPQPAHKALSGRRNTRMPQPLHNYQPIPLYNFLILLAFLTGVTGSTSLPTNSIGCFVFPPHLFGTCTPKFFLFHPAQSIRTVVQYKPK